MGRFSNGTEGDEFEVRWCARCVHCPTDDEALTEPECPVWELHSLWNSEQLGPGETAKVKETALDTLIPREGGQQECRMFHARKPDDRRAERAEAAQRERENAWLAKRGVGASRR